MNERVVVPFIALPRSKLDISDEFRRVLLALKGSIGIISCSLVDQASITSQLWGCCWRFMLN